MTCTHGEFGQDAGFCAISRVLSRLAESQFDWRLSAFVLIQWRPVWWWPFRVPAGMRCVFSELFFRMGGREESHGNLVVASLSNFQTIACMSPGCARHQQSLALQHQKSLALQQKSGTPANQSVWYSSKSLVLQHINRKHESGLRPAPKSLVPTSSTTVTTVAPLLRKMLYHMHAMPNHALTFGLLLYQC